MSLDFFVSFCIKAKRKEDENDYDWCSLTDKH
jgi:hypothetical protein